ncbi:MAG: glycerol-3-phosphate acyltransferase [Firmicutes bacterium]|nr:glycerol-3-phosphate acyltransferase [Bacillota bacterium]HXL03691.1 glycerol-3-phosphate acyltransferase [Bacillota bacterium]
MTAIAVAATSYFMGSIPFSYIWAKVFSGIDIRRVGSGNVGTTNVFLSSGIIPGLLSGIGDLGKGVAAVFFAQAVAPESIVMHFVAALAAVIGHNWPVWLNFHGGGGLATCIGALLVLSAGSLIYMGIFWAVAYVVTRHKYLSSVASCLAVAVFLGLYEHSWDYFFFGLGMGFLLGVKQVIAWLKYGVRREVAVSGSMHPGKN